MGEDNILNLIANDNYIIVNKSLISELGLHEAIIIGELASEYNYYKRNGMLDSEGYFYSTIDNIKENTGLSKDQQRNALKNLTERNLLTIKVKGVPAKRYIKFNCVILASLLVNIPQTSLREIRKLDSEKSDGNNNNKNNKEDNKKEEELFNYNWLSD